MRSNGSELMGVSTANTVSMVFAGYEGVFPPFLTCSVRYDWLFGHRLARSNRWGQLAIRIMHLLENSLLWPGWPQLEQVWSRDFGPGIAAVVGVTVCGEDCKVVIGCISETISMTD